MLAAALPVLDVATGIDSLADDGTLALVGFVGVIIFGWVVLLFAIFALAFLANAALEAIADIRRRRAIAAGIVAEQRQARVRIIVDGFRAIQIGKGHAR